MLSHLKKLGPGLLFAGAAIGVSHLVQSTRAGANFGFGLLWALLLVNLFKYPFFQYGPRYAMATGESLIDGYKRLGKSVLVIYFLLTFATMFTIQTAVTIVTASLASNLIGDFNPITIGTLTLSSIQIWTVLILTLCSAILILGKYKVLDVLMKVIIVTLTISTIAAVFTASTQHQSSISFSQIFPEKSSWIFLIAFMGWMPAPLDISIWHSLWAIEKNKKDTNFKTKSALFDFNIGYIATIILGIGFLSLGALVMFNTGETLSANSSGFSEQLINMYTTSLGNWAYIIIGIAAFTTMFSTTLTTFDGSPRVMERTTSLLFKTIKKNSYRYWLFILFAGTILIFFFLSAELGNLVKVATVLSFLTAPFYAILNYKLIRSKHVPEHWKPSDFMNLLSILGIIFLVGFGIWYLTIL
ncbi:iron transporter [Winogradskyella sp. PC-19]|uniref:NRAMP family divalent metal transporter n=1 Tax=unclassified Winogradskyella TaxID=2615021 RepID=UPI000B3BE91E|nr:MULTISPECIES: divalent metal cation transporter [unclassified Winogradskyella]ARV10285.1 iron transporter [Winogradskyella sp. PC-19]RZN77958.1 MAG: divalent metal cation transporter [Winogradskyella sp.]